MNTSMSQSLRSDRTLGFADSITAISRFYHIDASSVIGRLSTFTKYLENYWEMAFTTEGFEVITAGVGQKLSEKIVSTASTAGLSPSTISLFQKCYQAFPTAFIGIKFSFSNEDSPLPTLYVRAKTELESGMTFIEQNLQEDEVRALKLAFVDHKILYGLGFTEKNQKLYIKTYSIQDVQIEKSQARSGFISHRLSGGQLLNEHKVYLPEVSLPEIYESYPKLRTLTDFLSKEMHYGIAGHIGALYQNGKVTEYKIYIERTGNIPTDFSAR